MARGVAVHLVDGLGEALDRLLEGGLEIFVEARVLDRGGGARADDARAACAALRRSACPSVNERDARSSRGGAASCASGTAMSDCSAGSTGSPRRSAAPWCLARASVGSAREVLDERARARAAPSSASIAERGARRCAGARRSRPRRRRARWTTRSAWISLSALSATVREHLVEREARGDGLAHLVERERLPEAQVLGRRAAASRGRAARRG